MTDLHSLTGHRFADRQWCFDLARATALADALAYACTNGQLPPTLAFSADLDNRMVDQLFELTGLGPHQLLHGEQHFHYHQALHAGSQYRVSGAITTVEEKSRFHLLHTQTRLHDGGGALVVEMRSVFVAIPQPDGPVTGPLLDMADGESQAGPILSRERIAAFAAASGDDNPVHLQPAIAQAAGHSDVFAQGMLGMGLLAALMPPGRLQRFGVRFLSPLPVNEVPVLHRWEGPPVTLAMTGLGGQVRIKGYANFAR